MLRSPTHAIALCAVIFTFVVTSNVVSSAEVTCIQRYGDVGTLPIAEDIASKVWPSGFRPSASSCNSALIRGTIEKGDYERYLAFYRQHHRALQSVYMVSQGGDAHEAMKIGRLLRKYLISATAPSRFGDRLLLHSPAWKRGESVKYLCSGPTCVCASACALIWFGGVDRSGQVGLHRPRINDPQFKALPAADAGVVYKRALQEISRYLEEMEAPRPLIDTTVATASSEIRWVEVSVDDSQLEYPPSFIEWIDASCGSYTSQERRTESELSARKAFNNPLTDAEAMLSKMLTEKSFRHSDCRLALVRRQRDVLASP